MRKEQIGFVFQNSSASKKHYFLFNVCTRVLVFNEICRRRDAGAGAGEGRTLTHKASIEIPVK